MDTEPQTVSIANPASNSTIAGSATIRAAANDNKGVTKVEFLIDGLLESTDTSEPWEYSWNAANYSDGNHNLSAKAYDAAGNVGTSPTVVVTVQKRLNLTFRNTVFTVIRINVQGQGTREIQPSATTTFVFNSNPGSVPITAETSGGSSTGARVGLLMQWSYTVNTSGKTDNTEDLSIGPDYFFVYVTNTSGYTRTPLVTNAGTVDELVEYVEFPSNGIRYSVGYYKAFANTQVRLYRKNTSVFTYWIQGTHFTFPWTTNQAITAVSI